MKIPFWILFVGFLGLCGCESYTSGPDGDTYTIFPGSINGVDAVVINNSVTPVLITPGTNATNFIVDRRIFQRSIVEPNHRFTFPFRPYGGWGEVLLYAQAYNPETKQVYGKIILYRFHISDPSYSYGDQQEITAQVWTINSVKEAPAVIF